MSETKAVVGVIMGSQSDWHVMKQATDILEQLGVAYEAKSFPLIGRQNGWLNMRKPPFHGDLK